MKKRSMLAIASLATGFVVAAVTPSHSLDGDALTSLSTLDLQDTLSTVDQTVSEGSLATDETPGQDG
ncbi:hypothetical protein OG288_38520 [Streptomyces tauricus]|uniref:Secreted protein n=1 Tax=Streptomyces tauricus TaxID=68274 RepID=A0ABZ1JPV8_9ACTN|nr:hypothetical protein [Streptomyces tauricus]MCW8096717.1 hypothetical protein [Streptomyces tauricus]